MLQIIVAAARVRLIGAGLQDGDENRREHCEGKKHGPPSPAIAVAKRFPDHSDALLFTVCPACSRAATAANRASEATSRYSGSKVETANKLISAPASGAASAANPR